ncbi:MAG: hypothetical protein PF549_03095 [Patescibacteria group bacterium]|nr:hypothetical protein [Patescibacteria group bacterium]
MKKKAERDFSCFRSESRVVSHKLHLNWLGRLTEKSLKKERDRDEKRVKKKN